MESFVDLSYRGLSLGRRVKLTQVRPTSGYLETPAPMPVGTSIHIATDEGLSFDAVVTSVREQVNGTEAVAGMTVSPALAGAAGDWWSQRATLPEAPAAPPPPPPAPTPVKAAPEPPVITRTRAALPSVDPLLASLAAASQTVGATGDVDNGKTQVMSAVADPDEPPGGRTEAMAAVSVPDEVDASTSTPVYAVVDDGKATTMMDAVDPAALGLLADDDTSEPPDRPSSPSIPGSTKKRRKKNR